LDSRSTHLSSSASYRAPLPPTLPCSPTRRSSDLISVCEGHHINRIVCYHSAIYETRNPSGISLGSALCRRTGTHPFEGGEGDILGREQEVLHVGHFQHVLPDCGIQGTEQSITFQTSGANIAALQIFGAGPVRQAADATTRGHQLHHHDGELGIAHGGRLYAGGIEKAAEDVQPVTLDRIADEGFPGQVPGLDKAAAAQRMLVADGQDGLV